MKNLIDNYWNVWNTPQKVTIVFFTVLLPFLLYTAYIHNYQFTL